MRKIYLLSTLVLTILCGSKSFAQDLSNKGKEFWLAYPAHNAGTASRMALYLTSDQSTTGTVTFNGNSIPFTITANQTTVVRIGNATAPSNASCYIGTNNVIEVNKGIRITSAKAIVAYSHILNSAVSGSTLLLPKNVLGREYVVSTYVPQGSTAGVEKCQFVIVGVEDNTTVDITPRNADISGTRAAGVKFQIVLNKGDVYQYQSFSELSGSTVKSIASGTSACQKIVVFGSTTRSAIGCTSPNPTSGDNLYQQLLPVPAWGKSYITVPFATKSRDIIRIYVSVPTDPVTVNGTALALGSLIAGSYYEITASTPQEISSISPISVYQYIITQNCDGVQSDPEMVLINSTEQTLKNITLVSAHQSLTPPNTNITSHYVNLVIKNTGTALSSLRIDGLPPSAIFSPIGATQYVYAQINLTATTTAASPSHRIVSDSGFIAIAYGFGNVESYGYNAGTFVKDPYQQIGITTEFGIEQEPSVCKGSPFRFKVSLPYCADSLIWDLSLLPGPPINPGTQIYTNCLPPPAIGGPDSTTTVNGKTLYWYSLPLPYTFNTSGTFPVNISTHTTAAGNPCGAEQEIDFELNVYDPPVADFNFTNSGCLAEPVLFTDNTTTPRPSYIWNWNFGDPGSGASNTSGLQNPSHIFSAPGTYNVTFSTITTPGCISAQVVKPVVVKPLPSGSISGANTVCINTPSPDITFTAVDGTAPYTFTYNINGGGSQTISTTGTNTTVTLQPPTNVAGTFRYNLIQVKNTGSTLCVQNLTNAFVDIIVNPDATITLTSAAATANQSVCESTPIADIIYAIGGGGSGGTITGLPSGVTGVYNAGIFTISGTPTATGTFNYTVSTTGVCIQKTATGTITVNPDAAIVLTSAPATTAQQICINTLLSDITYAVSGGGTGAGVTGLPAGVSGNYNAGVFTISGTPTVIGSFSYTITTTGTCVQKIATGTITVDPDATLTLTSAPATANQTLCINIPINNITYAIAGGGTNGGVTGLPAGVTGIFAAGIITISGTPTVAGTFPFTVTTTGTCIQQNAAGSITVNPDASITLTSAPSTTLQEMCFNTTIANITYSITGGGTGATITGLPAGVTGVYSGGVFTISGTAAASGTFNYTVTTTGICVQKIATGTIIINPLPTPDFTVTAPTCETKVLTFTDLSSPNVGTSTAWAWDFGDAIGTSSVQNPTYTYTAAGTYPVSLSVTNSKGCVSNPVLVRSVTVNPQPVNGFILPEVCLSDTYAQFTDTSKIASGSIASWLWNFGDPGSGPLNTSTLQHPQHSYTAVGNYTVTLTTTSNNGCVTVLAQTFTVNGDIPVSNFNALNPATMCANDSVSIQDASTVNFGSVTKVEIYWDNVNFPAVFQTDDFPTSGKIYKHLYPNFQSPLTKTFTIRYRAYSGATCVNDRIKVITVNAAPKVQFNTMPDVCLDAAPFQITQATEVGGVPGPPGVFSGPGVSATGIFNPASVGPGTYLIKYTFTSTAGGCVDTLSKPITVLDSASARFTYSTLLCEKTAVTFNSSTSTIPVGVGTITGWGWNFGDPASGAANTSASQNPSHLFSGWGTYNVTLFVTTSNGCRSTVRTIPVFINPVPRPDFSMPPSSCLPSATVAFNSAASSIPDGTQATFTYLWDFGDPASGALNSATGSSPSHIYNTVGPFNVNLQITSGAGCVDNKTIALTTVHPQPTGAFTVNKPDVCVGQSFTFTDNSNPAGGITTQWTWNMGNAGTPPTGAVITYTYPAAGTYDVTLISTNSFGCRSTVATRTVTVNPYPTVNAGPDLFILEGGSDTLEPIITNDINPTYLWTPNQYFLSSNTIKNPVVKGVDDITYTLVVTGRGGCARQDEVFIKVLKGPEIPNIFSPNGDGVHDKWIIKYLDTYPGGTVEIFNRYGQLIFRSVGYGIPWDGTIDGKPVPIGTYYYIVNPKNGRKTMSGYVDVIR